MANTPAMQILNPIVSAELPVIQKIIDDETWLEGERRGCWVSPQDPVVVEHVCTIILRVGRELRESMQARMCPPLSWSQGI